MHDYCAMYTCPFLSSPNLSLPPSVLNCWHLITVYSAKTLNQIINTHIHIYLHIISIYWLFYLFFFRGALVGVFWYPSSCRPQEDGPWMIFNLWEVGKRLLGTNRPASGCLNGDNFVNISAVVEFYQTENLIWRGCVSIENNTTLIL